MGQQSAVMNMQLSNSLTVSVDYSIFDWHLHAHTHLKHTIQTPQVLECAWDDLLTKVEEAKDLDYIIAAHQVSLLVFYFVYP